MNKICCINRNIVKNEKSDYEYAGLKYEGLWKMNFHTQGNVYGTWMC